MDNSDNECPNCSRKIETRFGVTGCCCECHELAERLMSDARDHASRSLMVYQDLLELLMTKGELTVERGERDLVGVVGDAGEK